MNGLYSCLSEEQQDIHSSSFKNGAEGLGSLVSQADVFLPAWHSERPRTHLPLANEAKCLITVCVSKAFSFRHPSELTHLKTPGS